MYPIAYSPIDTLPSLTKPLYIRNRFGLSAGPFGFRGPFGTVSFFAASKWGSVALCETLALQGPLLAKYIPERTSSGQKLEESWIL